MPDFDDGLQYGFLNADDVDKIEQLVSRITRLRLFCYLLNDFKKENKILNKIKGNIEPNDTWCGILLSQKEIINKFLERAKSSKSKSYYNDALKNVELKIEKLKMFMHFNYLPDVDDIHRDMTRLYLIGEYNLYRAISQELTLTKEYLKKAINEMISEKINDEIE